MELKLHLVTTLAKDASWSHTLFSLFHLVSFYFMFSFIFILKLISVVGQSLMQVDEKSNDDLLSRLYI